MANECFNKLTTKLTGRKIVCPWWLCFTFDNPLRTLIHDPEAILSPYVRTGFHAIDIGCGMGYFTIPLAKLVGPAGLVTAVDVQSRMLAVLARRARKSGTSEIIRLHLADRESLGSHEKADFILAFWMFHEIPDQGRSLAEIYNLLKPEGRFLLVEPVIHVPGKYFLRTLKTAEENGFVVVEKPDVRMSHSALLARSDHGL
jgi:ubiquinone/menaquinone biosynthesis C-methylase UbiE